MRLGGMKRRLLRLGHPWPLLLLLASGSSIPFGRVDVHSLVIALNLFVVITVHVLLSAALRDRSLALRSRGVLVIVLGRAFALVVPASMALSLVIETALATTAFALETGRVGTPAVLLTVRLARARTGVRAELGLLRLV